MNTNLIFKAFSKYSRVYARERFRDNIFVSCEIFLTESTVEKGLLKKSMERLCQPL